MGKRNMLQQFIDVQEKEVAEMVDNSNGRVQKENMEIEAKQKVIDAAKAFLVNGKMLTTDGSAKDGKDEASR